MRGQEMDHKQLSQGGLLQVTQHNAISKNFPLPWHKGDAIKSAAQIDRNF